MSDEPTEAPPPVSPLRWFPEFWALSRRRMRSQARLMGLALLVGMVAGLGAIVFFAACQTMSYAALDAIVGYRPRPPGGEPPLVKESEQPFRPWLLLIVPAVGGLLSGWIVYSWAPEAEGHGTDAAIEAYHFRQGKIRPRVPLVKIVASALTLGSGGSGGREGPIALIGAGFGSYLGGLLRLRAADRRILMAAGMGAGVAAIFRAPLAGALFAAEVLYRSPDFESEVIIPAGLASVIAYSTFGAVFGFKPLFHLSPDLLAVLSFSNPLSLAPYLLLALFMVVLAMCYTRTFYGLVYLFHRLKLRPHFKPALGAFLSAVLGLALYYVFGRDQEVLGVLSFGYGALQGAIESPPGGPAALRTAAVLLAIALGKILTTGLTIGSGGSGGVFGPSMVIGGCGGGALGILLHRVWPELAPHPASFVIVGMAGFFAAAAKTPFSTLVMVSEMTGNYNLLLPTLWVCSLTFLLSDEQSIYSSQLASRSRSPAHQGDYVREALAGLRVERFIPDLRQVPTLSVGDGLTKILELLKNSPFQTLPVTDPEGCLLGIVDVNDIHLASQSSDLCALVIASDLMRSDVTPLCPDDPMERALELFIEHDLSELPLVDTAASGRLIGVVGRSDISRAYLQYLHSLAADKDAG
ncbi:MAG TPA: chloride channel protein [Pirellulales bacterium]|nr:chloride channel protein [Pirellulales bacterium]